jgi:hypothetical protein
VGLDNIGYKIVPILTQGDAEAKSTAQFKELERKFEEQEASWSNVEKSFTTRSEELQAQRALHLKSQPEQMEEQQRKSFERKLETIDEKIVEHGKKLERTKATYNNAKVKLKHFYWNTIKEQNRFAEELSAKDYHAPFVWANLEDHAWRGGNQLYSDASEPNNIPKGLKLSTVAKLIQPHPDLRVITIGKSHMHLSKLLERIGGYKFAAATKFIGTTFLNELNPLAVTSIQREVNAWSNRIIAAYRKKNPSSTATVKLLLVWIRGLNSAERSGVQGLKKRSLWDAEESVYQFSPFNHHTIHDAKKNPHHVMNVQIFKQLSEICARLGGKHTHVIPVAIGDTLLEDMYDPQSPAYIDKNNLDHLVEYWTRAQPGVLTGEAGMLKQRTFLLGLWKRFEIVQIGVRSGMLEFMAYNGLPTIYLEREVDCHDPESGAPRIKQLAYEIEEMYSPGLALPRLPWFRMRHQVNVGLSQYKKATLYNPKIKNGRKITGVNETDMLGYFNPQEMKTLSLGLQNIFQSAWARRMRAVAPRRAQYGLKDVEGGEFGLLHNDYAAPYQPVRRIPSFEIEGWDPRKPNLVPDALIARGVGRGDIIKVNGIDYRVHERPGMKEPTDDNPFGKILYAVYHLRGG